MSNDGLARRLVALKDIAEKDQIIENYLRIADLPRNLEYVRASKRQKAYYRRRPCSRDNPGPGQVAHRLEFSIIATENFGKKGKVTMPDGREISRTAYLVGKKLKKAVQEGPEQDKEVIKLTKIMNAARTENHTAKTIGTPWM